MPATTRKPGRSAHLRRPGAMLTAGLLLAQMLHRDRTGLLRAIGRRAQADAVLMDLRKRALAHALLPVLPLGWRMDADLRSAGNGSFCGDFLIASHRTPNQVELVLVDVSGNGRDAGGRALLFTGAFASLLEAVAQEEFLPAANRYVLRHGGDDGFATAVHASVRLDDGTFRVASAGHPPAAHYRAGAGTWQIIEGGGGPLLGVLADAGYGASTGRLKPGDALLLYTDGLVENRRLDVSSGIDRLIGRADPVLAGGMPGGAALIAAATRTGYADDRALVVVQRLLRSGH